ncbi:hypothetical protein PIB30_011390 [Stylosanthes scabra]|uniref:Uncharacterized protein n=1 Tax=Stylosanthes scabra TaxID=79078 RepID=A0ABU6Y5Y4_9FABA|nr:hypothetical protein [Stylosanthes scabra]
MSEWQRAREESPNRDLGVFESIAIGQGLEDVLEGRANLPFIYPRHAMMTRHKFGKVVTPQASTTQLKSEPVELKVITRSIRDETKTISKEWKKDITRSQITS